MRKLFLSLLSALATGCASQSGSAVYVADTGNRSVDAFVAAVQRQDETAVAALIDRFETISGLYPQYRTAKEYLGRVRACRVMRVAQYGVSEGGDPVAIDRSLERGPRARPAGSVYSISWDCPEGRLRQAPNPDFYAPKIMVAELLPPSREVPVMRPPAAGGE